MQATAKRMQATAQRMQATLSALPTYFDELKSDYIVQETTHFDELTLTRMHCPPTSTSYTLTRNYRK